MFTSRPPPTSPPHERGGPLRAPPDRGVLDLDEGAGLGPILQDGPGAKVRIGTDARQPADPRVPDDRELDHRAIADPRVLDYGRRAHSASLPDPGLALKEGHRQHDGVATDAYFYVDVGPRGV